MPNRFLLQAVLDFGFLVALVGVGGLDRGLESEQPVPTTAATKVWEQLLQQMSEQLLQQP